MTPIETVFRGHRFRSRLEARWAVFFDVCGVRFWYEPEGFSFSDGTQYLPDFYLPDHRMYCEIKPKMLSDAELRKVKALARHSGAIVVLAVGPPDFQAYPFVQHIPVAGDGGESVLFEDSLMLTMDFPRKGRPWFALGESYATPEDFSKTYVEAVLASRAARFGVFE